MSIARTFIASSTAWLLYRDLAFRVERIDDLELRHRGHALLEGIAAVSAGRVEADQARMLQILAVGQNAATADERAATYLASERARGLARLQAMGSTPEGEAALLERADEYLCRAITGVARQRHPVPGPPRMVLRIGEVVDSKSGAVLELDGEVEAWRFVRGPDQQDPDANPPRISVTTLPLADRQVLGLLIKGHMTASLAKEVTSFR